MKTDDLIELLSRNVEPADPRLPARNILLAVGGGAAAAALLVLAGLGLRPGAAEPQHWLAAALKVAFAFALLIPATGWLMRLARPGGGTRLRGPLLALPFAGIIALAALSLAAGPRTHLHAGLFGEQWLECVLSIPLIAILPFATIVWAVRQTAPTNLPLAGAVAGLIAGCLSAAGYALHCADDSVPFVALWYGGTIALCTLAGWRLGPLLLRW